MKLASRMSRLGTETAFEALARAKALEAQGRSIVFLGIGEPDFDTPEHIIDAAKDALESGFTHYTPSTGIPAVREVIAADMSARLGYEASASNVIVTPGGKPIMFFTILALAEAGDEVIYPNPGFPIYESMIRFAGATPVPMQLREELDYNPDIDELRSLVSPRTKLIIINSPNNPCGSVIPEKDLEAIAELANEVDAVVLSDEIYKDFYFEGEHVSITKFPGMRERTVVLDGLSKSYAMTGWRIGYGLFPGELVEPITRLVTNSVSCTAAFSQMAAMAAIQAPQEPVYSMVAEFKQRRDILVDGLNAIPGISCPMPKGAFYAFPNISGTGLTSQDFEARLLNETGVSILAGTSFGAFGEGYARFSFANSQDNLREALRRIGEWVPTL
ncbi:MAG: pyridoxal phosphate-dependent aminotransferase [Chloroflexi bacterium]|nr:pyridoxal phosphate-dependent aminotransferase [Chloroflexota bacterium]MDA1173079.1 pyridoxal phosphate-dependent aminotransferase [Chloroflexota bacterium]